MRFNISWSCLLNASPVKSNHSSVAKGFVSLRYVIIQHLPRLGGTMVSTHILRSSLVYPIMWRNLHNAPPLDGASEFSLKNILHIFLIYLSLSNIVYVKLFLIYCHLVILCWISFLVKSSNMLFFALVTSTPVVGGINFLVLSSIWI